ncbi:NEP1-interacting protein 1, partial [Linum perenne]
IRQWKRWEDSVAKMNDAEAAVVNISCSAQMGAVETSFEDVPNIFDTGSTKGLPGDSVEKIPKIKITNKNNVDASGDRVSCSVCLQLVSMDIRDNFLVAERGWMACILLDSICSLHCKKHPDFSSRVIFLFVESLTVLYPRETASASSRYEVGAHHNTVGSRVTCEFMFMDHSQEHLRGKTLAKIRMTKDGVFVLPFKTSGFLAGAHVFPVIQRNLRLYLIVSV